MFLILTSGGWKYGAREYASPPLFIFSWCAHATKSHRLPPFFFPLSLYHVIVIYL